MPSGRAVGHDCQGYVAAYPQYASQVQLERLVDYGLAGLTQVEGWFSPLDLAVTTSILVAQATLGVEGDIAEIGVWRGKSAILLSCFVREHESLHVVDVFDLYYPDESPAYPAKPYADPAIFRANMRAHGCPDRVVEVASDTRTDARLTEKLSGRGVRFFHIDGGHSYEHVVADCRTALEVVTEHCVLVLDDFMQVDNPAVTQAIFDTFRGAPKGLAPFAITGKKLYLCNRDDTSGYWRYLTALMPRAVTRKRPVLDASPLILNPASFQLSRDFDLALLRSSTSEPGDFQDAITQASSRFPKIDEWLRERATLNAM